MEGIVNGILATAWKAKVIEHDLSVGRNFYRHPLPLKVAVTMFAALLARTYASAGIYAHPYSFFRFDDEGLIVNFAIDNRPGASYIADPSFGHWLYDFGTRTWFTISEIWHSEFIDQSRIHMACTHNTALADKKSLRLLLENIVKCAWKETILLNL